MRVSRGRTLLMRFADLKTVLLEAVRDHSAL
jgi:hypothetical protein